MSFSFFLSLSFFNSVFYSVFLSVIVIVVVVDDVVFVAIIYLIVVDFVFLVLLSSSPSSSPFFFDSSLSTRHCTGAVVLSQILTWPPRVRDYTFYISAALFLIFGLKMLHEGYMMTPEEAAAEMEEVQQELGERRPAAARERRDVERQEELQQSLVVSEVPLQSSISWVPTCRGGVGARRSTVAIRSWPSGDR